MADLESNHHLHGLVDMGSNGIRFSITSLEPLSARCLPTVYTSRLALSLYDAQFTASSSDRVPIPQRTIQTVVDSLLHFKSTCQEFGVPEKNIAVLATEATRTAVNSAEYLGEIKEKTGWSVQMLSKEDEGKVGAFGVGSSAERVEGLVMDLGGGSTQITWMISHSGNTHTSPKGSFSFPYGAAAMTRRLEEISKSSEPEVQRSKLADEMKQNFRQACSSLEVDGALKQSAEQQGGYTLYLSGGGFRGWGYLLMSQHPTINPYPIPIINGFKVPVSAFHNTAALQALANSSLPSTAAEGETKGDKIFRVSARRASQVPAVAFLINVLIDALPTIKEVHFCQGGVREGYLFSQFPAEIRGTPPLVAATAPYATKSAVQISQLITTAFPNSNCPFLSGHAASATAAVLPKSSSQEANIQPPFIILDPSFHLSFASLLYTHSSFPSETAPLSSLQFPIIGILASSHGLTHTERAILALALCERWGGESDLPDSEWKSFYRRVCALLQPKEVWWARYLGRVGGLIAGAVYPSGIIRQGGEKVKFEAEWGPVEKEREKKGEEKGEVTTSAQAKKDTKDKEKKKESKAKLGIAITMQLVQPVNPTIINFGTLQEKIEKLEKLGKKKNWVVVGAGGVGVATNDDGDGEESRVGFKIKQVALKDNKGMQLKTEDKTQSSSSESN